MPLFNRTRLAALAGALLMASGAAALWFSTDHNRADASAARAPRSAPMPEAAAPLAANLPEPPPVPEKSREEKRFARIDRDDDGRITQAEYLQQRRRNFDKLDVNGDGRLSFEEYAAKGIEKFRTTDSNRDGGLSAKEFATTAPKPKKTQTASAARCICPQTASAGTDEN